MFGLKIKKYRELKNLTQEELAERMFLSSKSLGHYETGTRDCRKLEILEALTRELGFSILIKNGKTYIEEDFKSMKKENFKAEIMKEHKEEYMKQIERYVYGLGSEELDGKAKEVCENLFNSLLTSDMVKIAKEDKLISLETALYNEEEGKYCFLDFRVFEDMDTNDMLGAYLMIYYKEDLSEYEEYVDDVWEFANWV